jgi:hypothetical protein
MKKMLLILGIVITLSSCMGDGIERTSTNNDEYQVTYLFEKDGVKVYRFSDGLSNHYFTTLGETITTQGSSKNHHEENVSPKINQNKF